FERTATAKQALDAYRSEDDHTSYSLAGRIVALRPHGKTTFAHLEDASGKIQLYFKGDELGADQYGVLDLLDLGDHIGVDGRLMKTRTGEITLRVARFTLLASRRFDESGHYAALLPKRFKNASINGSRSPSMTL